MWNKTVTMYIEARIDDSPANRRGRKMLSIGSAWRTRCAACLGGARTAQAVNPAFSRVPHLRTCPLSQHQSASLLKLRKHP
jgi:hypothetical protein